MSAYGQRKDTQTQQAEHIDLNGVCAKRVLQSGFDGTNLNDANINSDGALLINSGMPIPEHDTIECSYTSGDLTGVVYKKDGVTVATLTLTYTDGNLTKVELS